MTPEVPTTLEELINETQWRVCETYGTESPENVFLENFSSDILKHTHSSQDINNRIAEGLMTLKKTYDHSKQKLLDNHEEIQRFAQTLGVIGDDTPCSTEESCQKLSKAMNACNTARSMAADVYSSYLTATNVMNIMISILCACIFVGPAHVCALRNFPYTCTFPYQVFGTFMQGSSSVFEVQKSLSSLCRMSTDPNIIPKIG